MKGREWKPGSLLTLVALVASDTRGLRPSASELR
jgi:hypothetical protein